MPALAAAAEETRLSGWAADGMPGLASFRAAYPGYDDTMALDALRVSEYWYLDAEGQIYLDYTGAGLPAQAQLSAHAARLHGRCFGNPHSENPTSAASTQLIERARRAVLDHNSVNGIGEFARARGARTEYVPPRSPDLRVDDDAVRAALGRARPGFRGAARRFASPGVAGRRGLFAFPAQSNFSGVQHQLSLIDVAHELGYDVLLDAAAYVPSHRLDLSAVRPDFVPVSWYKMFGYPTGVGSLIARREALARLGRPWFAGGTISAVSVQGDWHALADGEARFEDGTPSFLHIPDVEFGLSWIGGIGIDLIHERVTCLTGWMHDRLAAMRHSDGQPMAHARAVAGDAAEAGISVRTGCFCNPGAAEAAFGLSRPDVARARWLDAGSTDHYMETVGMPGGAIRASVGLASNIEDVQSFLALLDSTYRDHPPVDAERRLVSGPTHPGPVTRGGVRPGPRRGW